jgi:peptidoglycan DL-endopeptidase CwlO
VFTIKKLLFILSTIILLSIGYKQGLNIAHAAMISDLPLSQQTNPILPGQQNQDSQQGLNDQIKMVTDELQNTNTRMEQDNLNITSAKLQIDQLMNEINDLTSRISDREIILKNRYLSYRQASGNGTYLEVLLNSNNLNKLIKGSETEQTDQTILLQQETEKNDLKNKKDFLDKKFTDLDVLQTDFELLQAQLPIQQKQLELLKNQLEKTQAAEKELKEKTYLKIVTNAGNKYIGHSVYVFGGGRNARDIDNGRFDCSGFVHWAFAQAGIELGNSTDSIKNSGKRVSVEDMKPGDLVFFDTYKKDGHVGIYLGDGKFIGSQCSTGVAIEDMTKGYWKNVFKGHVERIQKSA